MQRHQPPVVSRPIHLRPELRVLLPRDRQPRPELITPLDRVADALSRPGWRSSIEPHTLATMTRAHMTLTYGETRLRPRRLTDRDRRSLTGSVSAAGLANFLPSCATIAHSRP